MPAQVPTNPTEEADGRVGRVLHQIAEDVKTIGADEIELAKLEVQRTARTAAIDAAVIMLGGTVALIGLGLLCLVVVVAIAPVIPPLWLRLLIMAVVYLVLGSLTAAVFARRIKRDAVPDLSRPAEQAKHTIRNIQAGLKR